MQLQIYHIFRYRNNIYHILVGDKAKILPCNKTGGGQLSSPLTFSNVKKQILWGNRFITFEK